MCPLMKSISPQHEKYLSIIKSWHYCNLNPTFRLWLFLHRSGLGQDLHFASLCWPALTACFLWSGVHIHQSPTSNQKQVDLRPPIPDLYKANKVRLSDHWSLISQLLRGFDITSFSLSLSSPQPLQSSS